jgi:hypothetical protein
VGGAGRGVFSPKTASTFEPSSSLTRGQLASILIRAYDDVGGSLPTTTSGGFSDIRGSTHETTIRQAAALGFVEGTGDGRFRPGEPVSRDQFASVLERYRKVVAGG